VVVVLLLLEQQELQILVVEVVMEQYLASQAQLMLRAVAAA
jgi:hypothetical protein